VRKDKVFEMFVAAAREVYQLGNLPDDTPTFFDLVKKYSKNVVPDIQEDEVLELSNYMAYLAERLGVVVEVTFDHGKTPPSLDDVLDTPVTIETKTDPHN
jgi:hypothetical protein